MQGDRVAPARHSILPGGIRTDPLAAVGLFALDPVRLSPGDRGDHMDLAGKVAKACYELHPIC